MAETLSYGMSPLSNPEQEHYFSVDEEIHIKCPSLIKILREKTRYLICTSFLFRPFVPKVLKLKISFLIFDKCII